jgi:hypothetical protein
MRDNELQTARGNNADNLSKEDIGSMKVLV